jgi:tRNA modification GTPase
LESLLHRANIGLHLVHPWRVVIAGPPNVGKSSLLNALLGYERAIVFDQPGTTRDVVAAQAALDGWPIELFDTAGLRESRDALEAAGIDLARQKLAEADLVLLVFDASASWTPADAEMLSQWPSALVVHNKCDLAPVPFDRPTGLLTSALTGERIGELIEQIIARLVLESPRPGDAVPFTLRQVELLRRTLRFVTANDVAAARQSLREIVHDKPIQASGTF